MNALKALRNAARMNVLGLQAVPHQRHTFTSQVKYSVSHADLMQLDTMPIAPIENPDGSLVFILDYDPLP